MRWVWAAMICVFWAASGAAAQQIDLSGVHAATVAGDAAAYADPAFDDSAWPRIPVPGSLRAAGLPGRPDVFWYRIAFEVPAEWDLIQPAVRLGIVSRSDAAYLNGVRIGGLGKVGGRLTDWHAYAPTLPRLYAFDPSLLRPGQTNVLAIRGAREPYIDDGGIVAGPVAILPLAEALGPFLALQTRFAGMQYLFFGLETMILLAVLIALALGLSGRHLRLFAAFYGFAYLISVERRGIAALFGIDGPGVEFAANLSGALSFPLLIGFVAYVLGRPVGRFGRAVQIGAVLALVAPVHPQRGWLQAWTIDAHLVWHLVMLAGLLMLLTWALQAARQARPYALPIVLGLASLFASLFTDILLPANHLERLHGVRIAEVGIMALYLALAFVMFRLVADQQRRLTAANQHIKAMHEAERARISRDLHDGLGQWLLAVKVRIDLLRHRPAPAEAIGAGLDLAASDIETAIDDVRRVSHDLAPALLEERGLVGAMRAHAERLSAGGVQVRVAAAQEPVLEIKVATEVFRIFQEALTNAIRHSGCSRIDVTVACDPGTVSMVIADDGCGFDPAAPPRRFALGITSMHSRARLLGADLSLTSGAGQGTELTFRLKRPPARGASA